MTLFVNGVSLRKLIGRLGLNQLSPFERTLRNQAVVVALEDLREKTKEIAEYDNIGQEARARVQSVFDATLASVDDGELEQLSLNQQVSMGLAEIGRASCRDRVCQCV